MYWQQIDALHLILQKMDIQKLIFFEDKFGYGALFWQFFALVSYPFRHWSESNDGSFIFVLRLINLSFQLLTGFVLLEIHRKIYPKLFSLWSFVLFIAFMPGLFFMWKAYSPDYLSAFSFVLCIYLITCFIQNECKCQRYLYSGLFFLGLSFSLKLYNAFFLIGLTPILLIGMFKGKIKFHEKRLIQIFSCLFFLMAGLIIGNLRLLSTPYEYLGLLKLHSSFVNSHEYVHSMPNSVSHIHRFFNWFNNSYSKTYIGLSSRGILSEFFGYPAIILGLLATYFAIIQNKINGFFPTPRGFSPLLLYVSSLMMLSIILLTNRVWTWYLLTPVLLLALSINIVLWQSIEKQNNLSFLKKIISLLFILHVLSSVNNLYAKFIEKKEGSLLAFEQLNSEFLSCVEPYIIKSKSYLNKHIYVPYGFPVKVEANITVYSDNGVLPDVFSSADYIFLRKKHEDSLTGFSSEFKITQCHEDVYFLERT